MLGQAFEDVLRAAQAGAEWAWTRLYNDLSPQVLGYLRTRGGREPEDLLGEVWVQVARNLGTFRGDERDLRAWVFTVAHHRVVDERRYRSRRPADPVAEVPEPQGPPEDVEERALGAVRAEQIRRLLEQLTPDQRDVLLLRILGGMTMPEVAKAIGKGTGAVKQLQRRGLKGLERLAEAEGVPLRELASVTRVA